MEQNNKTREGIEVESLTQLLQELRELLPPRSPRGLLLDRCIKLSKGKGWISVEDRLPEQGQVVDIFLPSIGRVTDIKYADGAFGDKESGGNKTPLKWFGATHWMPLPDRPRD